MVHNLDSNDCLEESLENVEPSLDDHDSIPAQLSNKWRAKLYSLNEEGSWDDIGTGHF